MGDYLSAGLRYSKPRAGTPAGWGGGWAAWRCRCAPAPPRGNFWLAGAAGEEKSQPRRSLGRGRVLMRTPSLRGTLMGSLETQRTFQCSTPKEGGASSCGLPTTPLLHHSSLHLQPLSAGVPSPLNGSPLLRGPFPEGLHSAPFCGVCTCCTGNSPLPGAPPFASCHQIPDPRTSLAKTPKIVLLKPLLV